MSALDNVNVKRLLNTIQEALGRNVMFQTVEESEGFVKQILDWYCQQGMIDSYSIETNMLNEINIQIAPVKTIEYVVISLKSDIDLLAPAGFDLASLNPQHPEMPQELATTLGY